MSDDELKIGLKNELMKIFQFDKSDLDFGIYGVMNQKREEIEKFINKDLIEEVEKELNSANQESAKALENEIKEIEQKIREIYGEKAFKDGKLLNEYANEEYFEKQKQLDNVKLSEEVEKEIFNHLINFFSRYYDEGDFISQRRIGKNEAYAIPYSGEEVLLYWANKDQYYVKTGEYFNKYIFKLNNLVVNFRVVKAEEEKNDIKSQEKKFFVLSSEKQFDFDEKKNELNVYFEYRRLTEEEENKYKQGNSVSQDKINEEIAKILEEKLKDGAFKQLFEKKGEKTVLEEHLNKYSKRNTTNYFIQKDLKGFLERELDFYIKNEVLQLEDLQVLGKEDTSDKLRLKIIEAKVFRGIALKIINFLAQIEDFQKKLWEKKKFVISTEYVITLNKIEKYAGEQFLESILPKILENKEQLNEWNNLFSFDIKDKNDLIIKNQSDENKWKKLPIDTKYFSQEFKEKLLEKLTENHDFDDILDGLLIKSENWQALNLLSEKYMESVKTIYIDPPYNTGSDGFLYKDRYQHSSWLTMMENRLSLAKDLLKNDGVIFVSIDDNEVRHLIMTMDEKFREENVEVMIWYKIPETGTAGQGKMKMTARFRIDNEYILVGYKDINKILFDKPLRIKEFINEYSNPDNDPRGNWVSCEICKSEEKSNPKGKNYYTVTTPKGIKITRQWHVTEEEFKQLDDDNRIYWGDGTIVPRLKRFLNEPQPITPSSLIKNISQTKGNKEIKSLFGDRLVYDNPKPSELISWLIEISNSSDSFILDFFAGSGTTAHAVMKLNKEDGGKRKFILVEMADYFDTIIIPRIKKVAYTFNWKDGKPEDMDGLGVFFKYQTLEQYEDSLESIEFNRQPTETLLALTEYFSEHMLDWETKNNETMFNETIKDPFTYKLKIIDNYQQKAVNADMIETFNYLLGLNVSKYKVVNANNRKYIFVFGKRKDERIAIVWRSIEGIELKNDKEMENDKEIIKKNVEEFKPEKIYINGDSCVENFVQTESTFRRLMFGKDE